MSYEHFYEPYEEKSSKNNVRRESDSFPPIPCGGKLGDGLGAPFGLNIGLTLRVLREDEVWAVEFADLVQQGRGELSAAHWSGAFRKSRREAGKIWQGPCDQLGYGRGSTGAVPETHYELES